MTKRTWFVSVGVLAGVRVAIPLVALLAHGRGPPGLPSWEYEALPGDAYGYHAAAREAISAAGRVSVPLALAAVLAVATSVLAARRLSRRAERRWLALVLLTATVALAATVVVSEMSPAGAAVVGWSLVWGAALAPYRALGLEPGPDLAFGVAFVLSLASLVATTVATAAIGLYATGRRLVGIGAAALFAVWPLLSGPLTGGRAWENGQWSVDVGLHLYTEPLSTALVAVSVALLLRPGSDDLERAGAGVAIGFATVVKLSNGLVGAGLVPLVAWRHGLRAALPFVVGGLLWVPLLGAYWPKGYVALFDGKISANERPWGLDYADDAWRSSLLFTWWVLLLLAPGLVLGCVAVRDRFALAFLVVPIAVTAVLYSFYDVTAIHPRFLYVTLPFVFVLEAAGVAHVVDRLRRRRQRPKAARRSTSDSSTMWPSRST